MKETAVFYKKARKFYDALARQLVRQGHALDTFACSLDQVPLRPSCSKFSRRSGSQLTPHQAGWKDKAAWTVGV